MKLMDRYIIRAFVVNYLISIAVLMSLFVVVDLLVNLDEFAKTDASLGQRLMDIASYYGYNLFLYFAWLAGAITLVASAFTLGRMVRDNELTALLAAGTSLYRVAAPVVVVGVLMNALWIVDQELIIPRIAHKLARSHDDVEGLRTFGVWFVPDRDGALLSAGRFYPKSRQMRRVIIIQRDEQGLAQRFIMADSASWDPQQQAWALGRGVVIDRVAGEAAAFEAPGQVRRQSTELYRSDLRPEDIMLRQAAQWTDFLSLDQIRQLEQSGVSNPRISQVKHSRVTQPLINMILLLIGVPFFLTREPRPVLTSGAMCVGVGGLFFVFSFVSQNLVYAASYPALPAWLPVIVFGPVAAVLLDSVKT
jgi:lipopolysaccharide export system permease protein